MKKRHKIKKSQPQQVTIAISPIAFRLTRVLLLPLVVLFVVSFSINSESATPLTIALTRLKQAPWKPEAHLQLTQVYVTMGSVIAARREMNLIDAQKTNSAVLGLASDYSNVVYKLAGKAILQKRDFWQKTAKDHPEYRDAWVQLLYVAYASGNLSETKEYLKKISALDPNFVNELPKTLRDL